MGYVYTRHPAPAFLACCRLMIVDCGQEESNSIECGSWSPGEIVSLDGLTTSIVILVKYCSCTTYIQSTLGRFILKLITAILQVFSGAVCI